MDEKIVRAYRRPEKQAQAEQMRRAMTPSEKRLWERLRANRLNGLAFRRQQVIDGFIADFYCRATRLVIECDGPVHAAQVEYDQERDRIIAAYNLRVLRFTNGQIDHDLPNVLAAIVQAADHPFYSKALP
jgi:very-short-patch-repair endonuclease